VAVVRRELSDRDWNARGHGQLDAPDGRTYHRRTTRMSRGEVEALVEAGSPVVTYLPGGRVVWHDEDDSWPAWADARTSLTSGLPESVGGTSVTAGRWESFRGSPLVVLVWHS
jgi:hypothetical protein